MTLDLNELARRALANMTPPTAPAPVHTPPPVGNQATITEAMVQAPKTCPHGIGPNCPRCADLDEQDAEPPGPQWKPAELPTASDFAHPESCIHCEADIVWIPETGRWVSQRGGFRVASCKASPTLQHEGPEDPITEVGLAHDPAQGVPYSTQIWQSVAGTEPKVTGATGTAAVSAGDPEAAQRKANFQRSVAELREQLGEPATVTDSAGAQWTETKRGTYQVAPSTMPLKEGLQRLTPEQGVELVTTGQVTVPNWPAQPMEPEDDPEAMAAELDVMTMAIDDYADRWARYTELKAQQAEHDRESKRLKAEADEAAEELLSQVPVGYTALVNGVPVFEVVESESTRVDIKKWQDRNPNWRAGRYAVTTTTPRLKAIKG